VYVGYAFGAKRNVFDAWSGKFQTAEATAEIPVLGIGVGGAIFRSPDNSLIGGSIQASFSIDALGPLGSVGVAVSEGDWTPVDRGTKAMGDSLWFVNYDEKTARAADNKEHVYLQFARARGAALSMVETLGVVGLPAAAHMLAIAALESAGLTYDNACSR
jgi:hypothetical protein